MKILTLITARGGSKRLPRKNIRTLGNKPLVVWSIDIVKDIQDICDVLVSTDDPEIADIARKSGALVPWLRPEDLATDTATSVDVALHALDWYEKENDAVDGLLLLQPTSPFRKLDSIIKGIDMFRGDQKSIILGISSAKSHPYKCYYVADSQLAPFIDTKIHLRSQDLPPAYVENGAFYLISPNCLRKTLSFQRGSILPLIMDNVGEDLDIDTLFDWNLAESLIASGALC